MPIRYLTPNPRWNHHSQGSHMVICMGSKGCISEKYGKRAIISPLSYNIPHNLEHRNISKRRKQLSLHSGQLKEYNFHKRQTYVFGFCFFLTVCLSMVFCQYCPFLSGPQRFLLIWGIRTNWTLPTHLLQHGLISFHHYLEMYTLRLREYGKNIASGKPYWARNKYFLSPSFFPRNN